MIDRERSRLRHATERIDPGQDAAVLADLGGGESRHGGYPRHVVEDQQPYGDAEIRRRLLDATDRVSQAVVALPERRDGINKGKRQRRRLLNGNATRRTPRGDANPHAARGLTGEVHDAPLRHGDAAEPRQPRSDVQPEIEGREGLERLRQAIEHMLLVHIYVPWDERLWWRFCQRVPEGGTGPDDLRADPAVRCIEGRQVFPHD